MTRRDPTSPKLGERTGESAARFLRVVRGHHDPARHSPDGVIDRSPPKVRDAMAQRSIGDVPAPAIAAPDDVDHEATLGAMLDALSDLGTMFAEATDGVEVDVSSLGAVNAEAVARWEGLRAALGVTHPLTRRARAVQIRTTILATDWIPATVIEHRQATRGTP